MKKEIETTNLSISWCIRGFGSFNVL